MYLITESERPLCKVNTILEGLEEIIEDATLNQLLINSDTLYNPQLVKKENINEEIKICPQNLKWLFEDMKNTFKHNEVDIALYDGIYKYWTFNSKNVTLEDVSYFLKRSFLDMYDIKEINYEHEKSNKNLR